MRKECKYSLSNRRSVKASSVGKIFGHRIAACVFLIACLAPHPSFAQDSWSAVSKAEQAAWQHSKEGDEYPPEESSPTSEMPTQYHEFAGMFKPYVGQDYDLKSVFLSGSRVTLHDYVLRAFQLIYQRHGGRPIPSLVKDLIVPLVALTDDNELSSFIAFINDHPTLPPSPPATTRQKLLRALDTIGLLDRIYHPAIFDWPKSTMVESIRVRTNQFLKRLNSTRGASLNDMFVLSILSDMPMADAVLIYPREVGAARIRREADRALANKSTPSLAYNNRAQSIAYRKIPWADLGMQHYDNFKGFFPWATMKLAENYYEYREAYELAEFTPVFGTMLSLVDGITTLYEGKDYYGTPQSRVFAGTFVALDAIDLVFTGGTVGSAAIKPVKFAKLGVLTKELKLLPRTPANGIKVLSSLRRGITEAMTSPGVKQACSLVEQLGPKGMLAPDGARAMLRADAVEAPAVQHGATKINGCIEGPIDTTSNMVLDSNTFMPLVAYKGMGRSIRSALTTSSPQSPYYNNLLKAYILGKVFEEEYSQFHLVLTKQIREESMKLTDFISSDYGLSPPVGWSVAGVLERGFPNRIFGGVSRHLDGADSYNGTVDMFGRFGIGVEQGGLHGGLGDQRILAQTLFLDRVGYAEPGAIIKPNLFTADRNFFASTAMLGGNGIGRGVNLSDKASYRSFARSYLGELDGISINLAERNIVDAFNEQLTLGNPLIRVSGRVTKIDQVGREMSSLPIRARILPVNCDDLNLLIQSMQFNDPRRQFYVDLLTKIGNKQF